MESGSESESELEEIFVEEEERKREYESALLSAKSPEERKRLKEQYRPFSRQKELDERARAAAGLLPANKRPSTAGHEGGSQRYVRIDAATESPVELESLAPTESRSPVLRYGGLPLSTARQLGKSSAFALVDPTGLPRGEAKSPMRVEEMRDPDSPFAPIAVRESGKSPQTESTDQMSRESRGGSTDSFGTDVEMNAEERERLDPFRPIRDSSTPLERDPSPPVKKKAVSRVPMPASGKRKQTTVGMDIADAPDSPQTSLASFASATGMPQTVANTAGPYGVAVGRGAGSDKSTTTSVRQEREALMWRLAASRGAVVPAPEVLGAPPPAPAAEKVMATVPTRSSTLLRVLDRTAAPAVSPVVPPTATRRASPAAPVRSASPTAPRPASPVPAVPVAPAAPLPMPFLTAAQQQQPAPQAQPREFSIPRNVTDPAEIRLRNFNAYVGLGAPEKNTFDDLLERRQGIQERRNEKFRRGRTERSGGPLDPQDPLPETRAAYRDALARSRLHPNVHVIQRAVALYAQLRGTDERTVCKGINEHLLYCLFESAETRGAHRAEIVGRRQKARAEFRSLQISPVSVRGGSFLDSDSDSDAEPDAEPEETAAARRIPATPWAFIETFCRPLWANLSMVYSDYVEGWCGSRAPSPDEILANDRTWSPFVVLAACEQTGTSVGTRPAAFTGKTLAFAAQKQFKARTMFRAACERERWCAASDGPGARVRNSSILFSDADTTIRSAPRIELDF